jgi:hypothetical protein
VLTEPDVLRRTLAIMLPKLDINKIKDKNVMFAEFTNLLSQILGFIFDTIAKAMKIKPTVKLDSYSLS